jgi:hypothetical protein
MPIAKLVSSDGPINIYYELHGRVTTMRDDLSVSNPAKKPEQPDEEQDSLSSASIVDPQLGRVKHAIDTAVAAEKRANAGKRIVDRLRSDVRPSASATAPKAGDIEMTDMSGRRRERPGHQHPSEAHNGFHGTRDPSSSPKAQQRGIGKGIGQEQGAANGFHGSRDPSSPDTELRGPGKGNDPEQGARNGFHGSRDSSSPKAEQHNPGKGSEPERVDTAGTQPALKEARLTEGSLREDEHVIEMPHEDAAGSAVR